MAWHDKGISLRCDDIQLSCPRGTFMHIIHTYSKFKNKLRIRLLCLKPTFYTIFFQICVETSVKQNKKKYIHIILLQVDFPVKFSFM